MNLTVLALLTLAQTTCTAHFGAGLNALNWYRNKCVAALEQCFESAQLETDVKACIAKSNAAKVCDQTGTCF